MSVLLTLMSYSQVSSRDGFLVLILESIDEKAALFISNVENGSIALMAFMEKHGRFIRNSKVSKTM